MKPLTPDEMRAVKYYEGDTSPWEPDDPFYGDKKAYCTLNCIMFDGLRSELLRVNEGKRLNPAAYDDIPRLTGILRALHSAADKGRLETPRTAYRVERRTDFEACREAGHLLAFTSTALDGFLPAYGDKHSLVLMTFHIPAQTPCIRFAEQLDRYLKYSETELLLPPMLPIRCTERALTDADRLITDMNGDPPAAAYDVTVSPEPLAYPQPGTLPPDAAEAAKRVLTLLNAGTPESGIPAEDVKAYCSLKAYLRHASAQIGAEQFP